MAAGSWSLAEDLFARGDEQFVAELRLVHFAERLGDFAPRWFADSRPFARQALFTYLAMPLNCYRHEPLVKRLFKLAEKAGDDELMGAFLAAFDRSVRRVRRKRILYKRETFSTRAAAEVAVRTWESEGYSNSHIGISTFNGQNYAIANKEVEVVTTPGNTKMPRPGTWKGRSLQTGKRIEVEVGRLVTDTDRKRFEKRFILFSLPTRRYLRRRAWRYFRNIGKLDAARYLRAAGSFLTHYTDADTDSDIHLLDNWGLVHALFRYSPALVCPPLGWGFAEGKSVADLAPAPRFEEAWATDAPAVFDLLLTASGHTVRQWAVAMMRKHHENWLAAQPVTTFLRLADHADPDLANLGFELLEKAEDLEQVPVEEWLKRLDGDDLNKLQRLSSLLTRRLDPDRVHTSDAVRLATHRSKPVAEFGFALLQTRTLSSDSVPVFLPLVQAQCTAIRPELIRWLRHTLQMLERDLASWVLEFLDSKHADVRAIGWEWLNESPLRDDPAIWQRLVETPYDDIRIPLVAELAKRMDGIDPDSVRRLWASVLFNIARGGRQKPGVVAQVVRRVADHPRETSRLLPLLAVAMRSLRGPEFRAGLAGVVHLAETRPELMTVIRERFPELQL